MNILEKAINAVKKNDLNFFKFLRANEVGATGSHQSGILISKASHQIMFDGPSPKIKTERTVNITWPNGRISACHFKYYESKKEFRITNFGKNFDYLTPNSLNSLFILSMINYDNYEGYFLFEEDEINQFLDQFNLSRDEDNRLINNLKTKPEEINFNLTTTSDKNLETNEIIFKPKAHILILLGEELIKSPVMAIYELIKNAYDADSKIVNVDFENIEDLNSAKITIEDFGTGISKEVIENVWFEPGTDFRKPIINGIRQIKRSPIFYRIPMGEKGVGRFAVHKLGHKIKLISRPAKISKYQDKITSELLDYEIIVEIDWRKFSQSNYLEDVKIEWKINKAPSTFRFKETHGTFIEISALKENWTRGMARQLKRNTLSMLSPKNNSDKFKINLNFNNLWLNEFPDTNKILEDAPYKLSVLIDEKYNMTFEYSFELKINSDIGTRSISKKSKNKNDVIKYERNIKGELRKYYKEYLLNKEFEIEKIEVLLDKFDSKDSKLPYGNLLFDIYSYDLDSQSMRDYTYSPSIVKNVLKDHSGIKVFKGDLRVYDYGDPGNDWLGLDIKRVNNKSWFSNNQNIAFIYLDDETSSSLIEKTNREGFIQNEAFDNLVVLMNFILTEFKAERQTDRNKWLQINKKGHPGSFDSQLSFFKELISKTEFKDDENKQKLLEEATKIEDRYNKDRDTLLIPAGVGMTVSFAIHEIEKLVPRMDETVNSNPIDKKMIISQVDELKDYTEGILSVLKKGGKKEISLIESIKQALSNYTLRLDSRNISVEIHHDENIDSIICDKRILITMIMNIIDNSIYWLETVYKDFKGIYISTYKNKNSVSILIVDNGPGFKDNIENIVSPFFSRKEGGIGIGMYLIDTVMVQYGKLNIISDKENLLNKNVPSYFNGAAVELIFKN